MELLVTVALIVGFWLRRSSKQTRTVTLPAWSIVPNSSPEIPKITNVKHEDSLDLTQDLSYAKQNAGKWGLLKPVEVSLDIQLREEARQFITMSREGRDDVRERMPSGTSWALVTFASRAAVFALRAQDAEIFRAGLIGIAMIEGGRHDPRDLLSALGRLRYTCERLHVNARIEFDAAALVADGKVAKLMQQSSHPNDLDEIQRSWRIMEVETDAGIGFAEARFERFDPESNLVEMAMGIAKIVEEDSLYRSSDLEIAAKIPATWLRDQKGERLDSILSEIAGCVIVRGDMDRSKHADVKDQSFLIFTMETKDGEDAQKLLHMAQSKSPKGFSRLGVCQGKLFSLVIGRSYVKGVAAVEDEASLSRFEGPLMNLLKRY
jgi:hypothetical protein